MSVISDLNIFCVNQKEKNVFLKDTIGCHVYRNIKEVYRRKYPLSMRIKGIWYYYYPINSIGERDYNNEFFALGDRCGKTFFVDYSNEEYKKLFIEIVKFYFLQSPDNKLVVFIYLDGIIRNKNIYISLNEYLKLANDRLIIFDTMYIISN